MHCFVFTSLKTYFPFIVVFLITFCQHGYNDYILLSWKHYSRGDYIGDEIRYILRACPYSDRCMTLRGYFSEIPLDILQALSAWAKRDGMAIQLTVDVTKDSSVTARYVLDPSAAERTISLLASAESPGAVNAAARFKRWFKNKLTVIATGQTDGFGMPVDIAVKVDLAGFDTENLYFYSYDSKTNQYRRIEKAAYWIDKNGYLHFTSEFAGDIIISEGPLERK